MTLLHALAFGFLSMTVVQAAGAGSPVPVLARDLAAQLDSHPLILLGEHHRSSAYHQMLQGLLHDSTFVCRVDDVIIESGSSRFQETADRFVSGATVPRDEKVRIWRDTTQWLVWDSPVYERILDTVRELNASHRCDHPIRVVLAEPPIPWEEVRSAADYRRYGERDQSYADVIEREVLSRGRRALMVTGGLHIQKRGALETSGGRPMVAKILESKYAGKILSIDTIADPEKAKFLGLRNGRLTMIRGTSVGSMNFVKLAPAASAKITVGGETVWRPLSELTWPLVQDVVDGFIYLGDDASEVVADPAIYHEPVYQAELRRRAAILKEVYGLDFLPELEELVAPATPAG